MADRAPAGLDPMFAPRSVAVIGASAGHTRIGWRPTASMPAQGFRGWLLPVNPSRADLLRGARGRPPADVPALAAMLPRLSQIAVASRGRIQPNGLNPVPALPRGEGAVAANAVIELHSPARDHTAAPQFAAVDDGDASTLGPVRVSSRSPR